MVEFKLRVVLEWASVEQLRPRNCRLLRLSRLAAEHRLFGFLPLGFVCAWFFSAIDFVLNSCLLKRFWELRKWLETLTKGTLAIALLH